MAFSGSFSEVNAPDGVNVTSKDKITIINWETKKDDMLLRLDRLHVYLVGECLIFSNPCHLISNNLERSKLGVPDVGTWNTVGRFR
jgi:hypothetical protein